MDLAEAKWCTDCEEIYRGEACPFCGSTVYWWLSKMLHVMPGRTKRGLKGASQFGHVSVGQHGPRCVSPQSFGRDARSAQVQDNA